MVTKNLLHFLIIKLLIQEISQYYFTILSHNFFVIIFLLRHKIMNLCLVLITKFHELIYQRQIMYKHVLAHNYKA